MKPRTKYQKQVVTSNKGLRPIKGAQMQWAFRECLDHYAFQLKHGQTTCMDCGNTWTTDEDADKCVCPKCKAKLEVQRTKRQKAMSSTYFSVLSERKGLQLMRAFQMKAYYRKGQKADIYCWEVARYWMNEKGKVEIMARKRTMGIYMDTFCYDSDIELRKDNTTYQHIASFPVCPDMKVIPQIWRNGFDGAFHGIEPLTLFKAMLTDHRIETMMKQCRYGHVRHFIDHPRHLETCWNAYKIANRNHYLITDIGKWADYICMLVEMGKDIRSPHYICPDNLEAEHDRISEKIRAKKEKEIETMGKKATFGNNVVLTPDECDTLKHYAVNGIIANADNKRLKEKLASAEKTVSIWKQRYEAVSEKYMELKQKAQPFLDAL